MTIDFFQEKCSGQTNKKLFGLCDDNKKPTAPAYLDEKDGSKWIAVVVNEYEYDVTFLAIDNCIEIKKNDGNMEKRCDAALFYDENFIFVELKERSAKGNDWVKDAEQQLKTTITYFEQALEAEKFIKKKAYIANSEHPKFKTSQIGRMSRFFQETGYVLRVENRIILE
jgi:hypothetical protein